MLSRSFLVLVVVVGRKGTDRDFVWRALLGLHVVRNDSM
jgi:hypothetical protein